MGKVHFVVVLVLSACVVTTLSEEAQSPRKMSPRRPVGRSVQEDQAGHSLEGAQDYASNVADATKDAMGDAAGTTTDAASSAGDATKDAVGNAKDAAGSTKDNAVTMGKQAKDATQQAAANAKTTGASTASTWSGWVKDKVNK